MNSSAFKTSFRLGVLTLLVTTFTAKLKSEILG